ncbi:MAG: hypothetical protein WDN69_02535 [Aliidongia sp.]
MVIYLLTALFLGGFGNYLIPLMVGARDMVFSLCQHAELLDLSARGAGARGGILRPRAAPTAAGWTLYPPQAILAGTPGADWGIVVMLISLVPVHHRLHDGRLELRGDGAAGAHTRHDADAPASDGLGHFHRHSDGAARLPRPVRGLRH